MRLTLQELWKRLYEGNNAVFTTYKTRRPAFPAYHPITNPYRELTLSYRQRAVALYHPPHGEKNKCIVKVNFLEMHLGDLLYFANPDAQNKVSQEIQVFISNNSLGNSKNRDALFDGTNQTVARTIRQMIVPPADSPENDLGKQLFMDDFEGNVLARITDANRFLISYFVPDLSALRDTLQSFCFDDDCRDPSTYSHNSYMGNAFWKLIEEDLKTAKFAENRPQIINSLSEVLTWYLLYALLQKEFRRVKNYIPKRNSHPRYQSTYACVRKLTPFSPDQDMDRTKEIEQIRQYIQQTEKQIKKLNEEGRRFFRLGIISPDDYQSIDQILDKIDQHNQIITNKNSIPFIFPYVFSQPISDTYWEVTDRILEADFDILLCLLWSQCDTPDYQKGHTHSMITSYASTEKPVIILFHNEEHPHNNEIPENPMTPLKQKYLDHRRRTEYIYADTYYSDVIGKISEQILQKIRQTDILQRHRRIKFHSSNDSDIISRIRDDGKLAKEISRHTPYVCEHVLYLIFDQTHNKNVWKAITEKLSHDSAYMRPALEFLAEHNPSHPVFQAGMPILAKQKPHEYVLVLRQLSRFHRELLHEYLEQHLIPDNDVNLINLLKTLDRQWNRQTEKHSF